MNEMRAIHNPVDDSLAVPLYHQVYLILKENIRSGEYAPDTALPIEPALCEEFGVSRITIKRAMKELVAEGLLVRQRGKGTFVAEGVTRPPPNALDDLLQSVEAIGAATDVQHLSSALVIPPKDVAQKLNMTSDALALRSHQLRLSGGEPLAIIVAYVPEAIAARLAQETENLPMLVRLNQAGIPFTRADKEVTATLADPAVAVPLKIEIGAPLLKLTRLVLDDTDQPV